MLRLVLSVILSVLAAGMLAILPLTQHLQFLWPQWLALVIIFWSVYLPDKMMPVIAFLAGIFLDMLTGTFLGEHALALLAVNYFSLVFSRRIRLFNLPKQMTTVFFLMIIYQGVIFWIQAFLAQMPVTYSYWLASISSLLVWPLVHFILYRIGVKLRIIPSFRI